MLVRTRSCWIMLVTLGVVAGCQTPVAAPGAAGVKVTQVASDVASCTAVGNISSVLSDSTEPGDWPRRKCDP